MKGTKLKTSFAFNAILITASMMLTSCFDVPTKQYSYGSIDRNAATIKRTNYCTILTNYGAYYGDYHLLTFDAQIDGILSSKSLRRYSYSHPGASSIKASGNKALMSIDALDKDDKRVIVIMAFDSKTKEITFVSAEEYVGFERHLAIPKDLSFGGSGFQSYIKGKVGDQWHVYFQIRGYDVAKRENYTRRVRVLYSDNDYQRTEIKVVEDLGEEFDSKLTFEDKEYLITPIPGRVIGTSEENGVLLSGTESWDITLDLETDQTYQRIRQMHGDNYFQTLGKDWKFDHRYIIQDDELYIIAAQKEGTGYRMIETSDYAFKVDITDKKFEYLGAIPRNAFQGILY